MPVTLPAAKNLFNGNPLTIAGWYSGGVTGTINNTAPPAEVGTGNIAGTILGTATTEGHFVLYDMPAGSFASGTDFTASAYFKPLGAQRLLLWRLIVPGWSATAALVADLTTGAKQAEWGEGTNYASGVEDAGGGWWRLWVQSTFGAQTAFTLQAALINRLGSGEWDWEDTYTGSASDGVAAVGVQINSGLGLRPYWGSTSDPPAAGAFVPAPIAAASTVTAGLRGRRPLSAATIAAASTVTAGLRGRRPLSAATIAAASTVTANLTAAAVTGQISATVAATSDLGAGLTGWQPAGPLTVEAASAIAASLVGLQPFAPGAIAASSGMTAALGGGATLAATVAASSGMSAGLRGRRPLSATIAATSTVTAGLRGRQPLAATIAAASGLSATPNARVTTTSQVVAQSNMAVSLSAAVKASAAIAAASGLVAALTSRTSFAPITISAATSMTAAVRRYFPVPFAATSGMACRLHGRQPFSATIPAVSGLLYRRAKSIKAVLDLRVPYAQAQVAALQPQVMVAAHPLAVRAQSVEMRIAAE